MSYDFEPWTRYPPLTKARLSHLADIIRLVRHAAILLHDPAAGDNEWSLGCRVYVRTCQALRDAAKLVDWLTILPDTQLLRFTFVVGSIPFKFYRGEADDPPDHYLIVSYTELHQQQLALELDGVRLLDQILRLAVEVDPKTREVSSVTLVEMDQAANLTGTYAIPFEAQTPSVTPLRREGVKLPPPPIEPLKKDAEEKDNERKDNTSDAGS